MSAHTPGPWKVLLDPDIGGPLVCAEDVDIADVMEREGGESEANARLIATAPELLEALRPFANAARDRSLREALIEAVKPNERASMRLALETARDAVAAAEGDL